MNPYEILDQCNREFGAAPREFSFWTRWNDLPVAKPIWAYLSFNDKINTIFKHASRVFARGTIVWAHVIQANAHLLDPGDGDAPGELVFSLADPSLKPAECLPGVAAKLFALKGTKPRDPELLTIADYLTDQMIRVFGHPVPKVISPKVPCLISTTFFDRTHLRHCYLRKPFLPVVVDREPPHVALPLPYKYWPIDLQEWWDS